MTPSMTAEEMEAAVRLAQQLVDEGGRYNLRGTNLQSVHRALLAATTSLARVMPVVDAAREWNRLGNEMESVEPGDGPALRRMRRACDDLRTAITAMRGEGGE